MNIPTTNTKGLISALEASPGVIVPMIREVPEAILRRRPEVGKWSAYENAVHLSQSDVAFRARLELILAEDESFIKVIENSAEDVGGAMLEVDLDESIERFVRERISLVEILKQLTPDDWQTYDN